MAYRDRQHRLISYHDTWISLDPIRGCPYSCVYCVLRHAGQTGTRPEIMASPRQCVEELLHYRLFVPEFTPLAIGNETDLFHRDNSQHLVAVLAEMAAAGIENPIVLITKAPLSDETLERIRKMSALRLVLFLSYSGLERRYEPNFSDEQLRENFSTAKRHGFPVVHYWRPLLPENTRRRQVREMLGFVSSIADATVLIGLKIHPELTSIMVRERIVQIPPELRSQSGEWLDTGIVDRIYTEAAEICPRYPLYRHASCALASILARPNHTGTIYRQDICPPSHCPEEQRNICAATRQIPSERKIADTLRAIQKSARFERKPDRILIREEVTQEEFAFLLHHLNCPLEVAEVKMANLYHGDIYRGQKKAEA